MAEPLDYFDLREKAARAVRPVNGAAFGYIRVSLISTGGTLFDSGVLTVVRQPSFDAAPLGFLTTGTTQAPNTITAAGFYGPYDLAGIPGGKFGAIVSTVSASEVRLNIEITTGGVPMGGGS